MSRGEFVVCSVGLRPANEDLQYSRVLGAIRENKKCNYPFVVISLALVIVFNVQAVIWGTRMILALFCVVFIFKVNFFFFF